mgnify:FL=1
MKKFLLLLLIMCLFISFCKKNKDSENTNVGVSNSDNFFVVQTNDNLPHAAFSVFSKKVNVFGVLIYATSDVSNQDLLHAANVMAQYLDNNEDSLIDNPLVLNNMVANNSAMVLFGSEGSAELQSFMDAGDDVFDNYRLQDLYGEEIHPNWNYNSPFDATFEEVLHLITHSGYSEVYPTVFGEQQGSLIANAMDIARGGQFLSIPRSYPANAWYSYDDNTCEYDCQVTEYFYWALTSLLGAQDYPGRLDEISHEWKANTPSLVQSMDTAVYNLISDSTYSLPTLLPDGSYRR